MAGPGGGPPRRSHTKSRKGCETCKRRHIRCDETFPQCRNCVKHKIRCPYNDLPIADDRSTTPDKPDLMWTSEILADIEQWQATGVFPFTGLHTFPTPDPAQYSFEDLRLIHHVVSICTELESMEANNVTLWTRQIPVLINIASTTRYVMDALLSFSAMHIADLTDCPVVGNLAYEHRGNALKGLHEAIGTFSRETSDAVLAASLILSWQATDWRSWTQLMHGTSSVIDAMEPWKEESQFIDFINESSTFPTAPPSPSPDHKPNQPMKEDIDALNKILQQLQKVETHLKHNKEDPKNIQQLISFLKGARKVSPTLSVAQQFERLRPLRTWLFYLPVSTLQQTGGSPSSLVTIAYYYTAALLMERLFPEIGTAYFGSMSIGPIEHIARQLFAMSIHPHPSSDDTVTHVELMNVPIAAVHEFRNRMGWVEPPHTPSLPHFSPTHFVTSEPVPLSTVSESYLPYGSNPAFSYSHESLPMLNTDSAPPSAVSPLSLSSPFPNSQYLNIPSPSYGAYSPASSTFEGSIAYSDSDEYGSYDYNAMRTAGHMFGGHSNNFGIGFVSPIQPVWN